MQACRIGASFYPVLVSFVCQLLTLVSTQSGLCPAPNGDFPNPTSDTCTSFFRCVESRATFARCPVNQRFHYLLRMCREMDDEACKRQMSLRAPPSLGLGLGGVGLNLGVPSLNPLALAGLGAAAPGGTLGAGGVLGSALGAGLAGDNLATLLPLLGEGGGASARSLATFMAISTLMQQPPKTGSTPPRRPPGKQPQKRQQNNGRRGLATSPRYYPVDAASSPLDGRTNLNEPPQTVPYDGPNRPPQTVPYYDINRQSQTVGYQGPNRPQTIGYQDPNRPQSVGYQGPNRPQTVGYQGPNRPQTIGYQDPNRPQSVGYQGPSRPQTVGYQDPNRPQTVGYQGPNRPQSVGYQGPSRPQTVGYQGPSRPQTVAYQDPSRPQTVSYDLTRHTAYSVSDGLGLSTASETKSVFAIPQFKGFLGGATSSATDISRVQTTQTPATQKV